MSKNGTQPSMNQVWLENASEREREMIRGWIRRAGEAMSLEEMAEDRTADLENYLVECFG